MPWMGYIYIYIIYIGAGRELRFWSSEIWHTSLKPGFRWSFHRAMGFLEVDQFIEHLLVGITLGTKLRCHPKLTSWRFKGYISLKTINIKILAVVCQYSDPKTSWPSFNWYQVAPMLVVSQHLSTCPAAVSLIYRFDRYIILIICPVL